MSEKNGVQSRLVCLLTTIGSLLVLFGLTACATTEQPAQSEVQAQQVLALADTTSAINLTATAEGNSFQALAPETVTSPRPRALIYPGTGRFINPQAAQQPATVPSADGEVRLNFEAADIRDVIKIVFDTLQENYTIDPRVQGEVTVQTSRPLPRDMLIPTLEALLRANGAALIRTNDLYKVVPANEAITGNASPRLSNARIGPGYSVRIFPLRYISALEIQKILEPFAPEGGILLVDSSRNLIILAGTAEELDNLQETINIFDVNWLQGMSVGFYRLENVESQTMATELEGLFGTGSDLPMAGMFRFVPINRLNAILVITPQPEFLREASVWIERLDGSGGERLYIYEVQNGDAGYLAEVLSDVFDAESSQPASPTNTGNVAPGLPSTTIGSSPSSSSLGNSAFYVEESDPEFVYQATPAPQPQAVPSQAAPRNGRQPTVLGAPGAAATGSIASGTGAGSGGNTMSNIRIIADVENNALLIWSNAQNYDKIVGALRKLDITPRQVLVEVTVAEVSLTGRLAYGLRWFFTNNNIDGRYTGTGSLNLNTNTTVNSVINSANSAFSYVIAKGDIVRALLEVLASESQVTILSSPQLLVIDNQDAEIQVGNQQPVRTSTTTTDGGNTTESISFKDTGVLLKVTPQVNSSGLVTMQILQQVIDVGQEIDAATGQRSFFTRRINSKVAVQSGQTIVLGGLISETKRNDNSGIPVLYKLPVIGPLFGSTDRNSDRTELLVLITPRVIQDSEEANRVTDELKRRMKTIEPFMGTDAL